MAQVRDVGDPAVAPAVPKHPVHLLFTRFRPRVPEVSSRLGIIVSVLEILILLEKFHPGVGARVTLQNCVAVFEVPDGKIAGEHNLDWRSVPRPSHPGSALKSPPQNACNYAAWWCWPNPSMQSLITLAIPVHCLR